MWRHNSNVFIINVAARYMLKANDYILHIFFTNKTFYCKSLVNEKYA